VRCHSPRHDTPIAWTLFVLPLAGWVVDFVDPKHLDRRRAALGIYDAHVGSIGRQEIDAARW
jgi:hypothetical protein